MTQDRQNSETVELPADLFELPLQGLSVVPDGLEIKNYFQPLLHFIHVIQHPVDGNLDEFLVAGEQTCGFHRPKNLVIEPSRKAYQNADILTFRTALLRIPVGFRLGEHPLPHPLEEEQFLCLSGDIDGLNLGDDRRRLPDNVRDVLTDRVDDEVRTRGVGIAGIVVDPLHGVLREAHHDLLGPLPVRICYLSLSFRH